MPVNMKTADGQSYTPARDLRHAYPDIVKNVETRFNHDAWPELVSVVEAGGGSWDGLCDAMLAVTEFLAKPTTDPTITMQKAMDNSGWFNVTDADRVGVCAMFGSVMLGQLHHAIRETTALEEAPQDMKVVAEAVSKRLLGPGRPKAMGLIKRGYIWCLHKFYAVMGYVGWR